MERRNFVKRLSVFTTGTIALSGSNLYASEIKKETANAIIDLSPLSPTDTIILKGNFIDASTLAPIKDVKMIAKVKRNRFFPLNESITSNDSTYQIQSGFSLNKNKLNEKVNIEIIADGYKTYNSTIYLTAKGCDIHSEEWNYNPNFKTEFCPKNINVDNKTLSTFNFHLVRN
jgi:hypothetical protein